MPNWNHIVRERLAALRLPPEREIEIAEELALHLEAVYEAALADGLSPAEAEARAVRRTDWRLLECELSRAEQPLAARALQPPLELIERRGGNRMNSFLQDLRFGARMLLKQPGFTLIAIITLALSLAARAAIQSVDRNQPVFQVRTLRQIVAASVAPRRLVLGLLGVFAAVALALAAIGIYGVMAYAVIARTHEWGIRLALGARGSDVLRLVLADGLRLALAGVAVGLAGAWLLTRCLGSVLYNVSATDPLTFAVIALLLTMIALLACYLPGRRATKVDPLIALRTE
jgi:FtsX-like permease family